MSDSLTRFQELLRELFQFDLADLDFGIYRILNLKRQQIEEFISARLPKIVDDALVQFTQAERARLEQELARVRGEIETAGFALGQTPFDARGALQLAFWETPKGKEYRALEQKIAQMQATEEQRVRTYNDLYSFFSRYYEDGDVFPLPRRGRVEIPFTGHEDVVLYWANKDQYYIKTGERFKTYRFRAGEFTVAFELRHAETTLNNVKGAKRYFMLAPDPLQWDAATKTLTVFFEYRPLTEDEQATYGRTETQKPQDKLNADAERAIIERTSDPTLKASLAKVETRNGKEASTLAWRLAHFTRRHTADFFIHKNLESFLRAELDHYIKTQVLLLDELLESGLDGAERDLIRARVVREVAEQIIAFLAQIENFQKRLFEKKKFVLRTDYCVTLDRVPEALWDEVLANDAQMAEWRALYALDDAKPTQEFLKAHPSLMIDTRHFDEAFKWKLLASFDDLDEAVDGVLVKSENWQALNLLLERYREQVKCIYIDPPYNTGSDDFIYRDNYQHSCWLAMMADRLEIARKWMSKDSVIFVSIDDNEVVNLVKLMNEIFEAGNQIATLPTVMNLKGNQDQFGFAGTHEYTEVFAKNVSNVAIGQFSLDDEDIEEWEEDEYGLFKKGANLKSTGVNAPREKRPNLFFPIYVSLNGEIHLERQSKSDIEVLPITDGKEMSWRWSKNRIQQEKHNLFAVNENGSVSIYKKQRPSIGDLPSRKPKSLLYRPEYSSGNGTVQIKDLFGDKVYPNPKPVDLIRDLTLLGTLKDSSVLDFFAGSGTTAHAVINLNCADGGNRKYILVEMDDYFDTVLLPRIKKVVFCDKWKDGKPVLDRNSSSGNARNGNGISHVVKYHTLEQYEDTLNNLELPRAQEGQLALQMYGDEYLLRYMLDFETQGSASLLNIEMLARPFEYRLKVFDGDTLVTRTVDLIETFNYLLGIRVRRYRAFEEAGRAYRAVLGEKNGKRIAIVWRPLDGLLNNLDALARDAQFITQTIFPALIGKDQPDRVLVNGACTVEGAELIEDEFKRLMFAEVS